MAYKPPLTAELGFSILNDLSQNEPGTLCTLKGEVEITVAVTTSLSAMFFILQEPFMFSESSYMRVYESSDYTTSPISLYSRPTITHEEIKSPHIFYATFDESF